MSRQVLRSFRPPLIIIAAACLGLAQASRSAVPQTGTEMICGGGFFATYASNGKTPGYVCMPESFNGALAVKADFRTGAIQAYLEGGALASRILTHPDAPNGRWYRGGFIFSGEASGALNPDDGQFSLEIIITGDEGGAWSLEGNEYETEVKVKVRRAVQLSGRVFRDGTGKGRIFSDDGPCRMEGEWTLTKGTAAPPAPPIPSVSIESIPKDLAHYYCEIPIPEMTPEPGAPHFPGDPFDEMAARGQGELEVVLENAAKTGQAAKLSFRRAIADLAAEDELRRGESRLRGEMVLKTGEARTLVLGSLILDALERVAVLPENAEQNVQPGESAYRGAETDFSWRIVLQDGGRVLARSARGGTIRYRVKYPVIFLPGTAGSRLSVSGGGVLDEVWPANLWRGTSMEGDRRYWQRLALDPSGLGEPVVATDIFRYYGQTWQPLVEGLTGILGRKVTPSAKNVYQGFLEHMAAQGFAEFSRPLDANGPPAEKNMRLFLFPYDWRLDIESHAPNLDRLIDRVLDLNFNREAPTYGTSERPAYRRGAGDKVVLIGHSQGGLVMRTYVALPERAAKIESCIMLGPPNLGSLNTFKALAGTGYNFEALFLHPEVGKWVGRNWTSPYQMLPFSAGGGLASFLLDENGRPIPDILGQLKAVRTHAFCFWRLPFSGGACTDDLTLNSDHLRSAVDFQSRLPNPAALGIPTFIIAGTGWPTIVAFRKASRLVKLSKSGLDVTPARTVNRSALSGRFLADSLWQAEYAVVSEDDRQVTVAVPYFDEVIAACGDGTVPQYSLVGLPGAMPIYVTGAKHGSMTENNAVQACLDRLLSGVHPVSAPEPICASTAAGASNGIRVRALSSPAVLHVYDSQGRHTGIAPDGTFEEGIPGSSFNLWGESQDVWLPASTDSYRAVLEGARETEVDLSLVAGDGRSEKRLEYLNVKESPGMVAEVSFASETMGPETHLKVDSNGDGSFEESKKPDVFATFRGLETVVGSRKLPVGLAIAAAAVAFVLILWIAVHHGRKKKEAS